MNEEKNFNKIAKYLSDNIGPEEREELFAWIKEQPDNKAIFENSLEVWETAGKAKKTLDVNTDAAWKKMNQRLEKARTIEPTTTPIRPLPLIRTWMKIAATIVLILGIGLWLFNKERTDLFNMPIVVQEKTTVELPDGSKVWLNNNTKLTYEKLFDKRVVQLEGEAFFEVQKLRGKPFEIYAGKSKTTVLGTSFNVRAYPKERTIEVAVEEGKVAFASRKEIKKIALLNGGEYAIYAKKQEKIEKATAMNLNAAAWKKRTLRFDDTKIEEVIIALERYFNIEIEVSDEKILGCIWNNTAIFEDPVLDNILKSIEYSMSNTLKIEKTANNTYRFLGMGCK